MNFYRMKLDHVVYFTDLTPDEIVRQQRGEGRHAVTGGSHSQWGTYNALLYTRNGYVEWLSVEDLETAKKSDQLLTRLLLHDLKDRPGWGTLCFSTHNITRLNTTLKDKGYQTSGVISAKRETPEGRVKRWKMLFINEPVTDHLPLPFFIEWEEPEKERYAILKEEKTINASNERLEITKCIFDVHSPEKELLRWSDVLSVAPLTETSIRLEEVIFQFNQIKTRQTERLQQVIIQEVPDALF